MFINCIDLCFIQFSLKSFGLLYGNFCTYCILAVPLGVNVRLVHFSSGLFCKVFKNNYTSTLQIIQHIENIEYAIQTRLFQCQRGSLQKSENTRLDYIRLVCDNTHMLLSKRRPLAGYLFHVKLFFSAAFFEPTVVTVLVTVLM